jgi:pimeloyl-ACP methyl ester carboxylesterase
MTKFIFRSIAATAFFLSGPTAQAAPPIGQDALAGPQVKVDVGGRKLNMACIGNGTPTVLFEADSGRAGWDWSAVLPEVAKRTRACIYDRAGFGSSDPIIRAATVANASKDLNFLLKNARMDGPFVLVGAGYGALVAQHFAWRSRSGVAGLVLVEPLHEDTMMADRVARLDAVLACLAAAEKGKAGVGCAYAPTAVNGEIGTRLAAAQENLTAKPSYWRAWASELDSLETSASQLRAGRKSLGVVPVVEVTHGEPGVIVQAITQILDRLSALSGSPQKN